MANPHFLNSVRASAAASYIDEAATAYAVGHTRAVGKSDPARTRHDSIIGEDKAKVKWRARSPAWTRSSSKSTSRIWPMATITRRSTIGRNRGQNRVNRRQKRRKGAKNAPNEALFSEAFRWHFASAPRRPEWSRLPERSCYRRRRQRPARRGRRTRSGRRAGWSATSG